MSEVIAVVAVHSASSSATRPRAVWTSVEAAVMDRTWSATTCSIVAGSTPATPDSCSSASPGVVTAP